MKKQAARTITILSLFLALSVSASHVSAFAGGCAACKPAVHYAAAVPMQVVSSVSRQSDSPPQIIALLWLPLVEFFASVL